MKVTVYLFVAMISVGVSAAAFAERPNVLLIAVDDLNDWIAARPEFSEHDASLRKALDHYLRLWLNAHHQDVSERLTLIPEIREDAVALTTSAPMV